jgi:predicted DNA-binding transcriptional regulator AlpA
MSTNPPPPEVLAALQADQEKSLKYRRDYMREYLSKRRARMGTEPAHSIAWPSTVILEWMRSRVVASGGDSATIPDEETRFWRMPEVIKRTGMSRTTIYRRIADGGFPSPLTLRS